MSEEKKFFGHLCFIIPDRKLTYKDKTVVELTEKESDIILALLGSGDKGITKEEVMSDVWMLNPNMETHTFETHLYRLRRKIKGNTSKIKEGEFSKARNIIKFVFTNRIISIKKI